MEARPHHHLLLLLLGLLTAAAAATGAQHCELSVLARDVSLFCAPDVIPTAQCCEPVLASVDLGGGVACLCRIANESRVVTTGLNTTHLLTLYSACGGLHADAAPSHLANGCDGPSLLVPATSDAVAVPAATQAAEARASLGALAVKVPVRCNADALTSKIVKECSIKNLPTTNRCEAIVSSVDIRGCLCALDEEQAFLDSDTFNANVVLNMYPICGGLRAVEDSVPKACGARASTPPPAPHAIATKKSFFPSHDGSKLFGLEVLQGFELAVGFGFGLYNVYRWWKSSQASPGVDT